MAGPHPHPRRVPDDPTALFWATVGGVGLTGVVLRARLPAAHRERPLRRRHRPHHRPRRDPGRAPTGPTTTTITLGLVRLHVTGRHLGRAVFSRGSLARADQLPERTRAEPLTFRHAAPRPAGLFPNGLAYQLTFAALGNAWYAKSGNYTDKIQYLTGFYHPLDMFGEWNRAYGPAGFVQYPFVVPPPRSSEFGAPDPATFSAPATSRSSTCSSGSVRPTRLPSGSPWPAGTSASTSRSPRAGRVPRRARRGGARRRRSALHRQGLPDHRGDVRGHVPADRFLDRHPACRRSRRRVRL